MKYLLTILLAMMMMSYGFGQSSIVNAEPYRPFPFKMAGVDGSGRIITFNSPAGTITIEGNIIQGNGGYIRLVPVDPPDYESYFGRGKVEVMANLEVGSGLMQYPTILFGSQAPGYTRFIGDHLNMYLSTSNPENGTSTPVAQGNLIVQNITVNGDINWDPPIFSSVTEARKKIAVGKWWLTTDGYLRKLMPLK